MFHDFQGCFESVSWKFQENFQGVSKKIHIAWHSSQLPEQKEGLFIEAFPKAYFGKISGISQENVKHLTAISRQMSGKHLANHKEISGKY